MRSVASPQLGGSVVFIHKFDKIQITKSDTCHFDSHANVDTLGPLFLHLFI